MPFVCPRQYVLSVVCHQIRELKSQLQRRLSGVDLSVAAAAATGGGDGSPTTAGKHRDKGEKVMSVVCCWLFLVWLFVMRLSSLSVRCSVF